MVFELIRLSSINSSLEDEIEDVDSNLRSTIEQVPAHNSLVIAGDLNAKFGSDELRFTFNSKTNLSGKMLKDLMDEFNLCSSNNSFMKPKLLVWTFEFPNGMELS